jgi:2-amino-4-hydroxy-6-hydroxymethyldihydropteridine diphosphokinase
VTVAVLSIGSNLGDRLATLSGAVEYFRPWLTAVSAVYETAPWGPVPQGDYLNAVLLVDDPGAEPGDWLARAHEVEDAAGRTRDVRFGARTLDVDVVSVDDVRSADPVLTLPHPRAEERAFVLVPWLTTDPEAVLPGVGRVAELVARLDRSDISGVRLREDLVLQRSGPRTGSSG